MALLPTLGSRDLLDAVKHLYLLKVPLTAASPGRSEGESIDYKVLMPTASPGVLPLCKEHLSAVQGYRAKQDS